MSKVFFFAFDENNENCAVVAAGSLIRFGQLSSDVKIMAFSNSTRKQEAFVRMGIEFVQLEKPTGLTAKSDFAPHQEIQAAGIGLTFAALDYLHQRGVEHAVYLDSDTCTVDNVKLLANLDYCGHVIAARLDYYGYPPRILGSWDSTMEYKAGAAFSGLYFNSGVITYKLQDFYKQYVPDGSLMELYKASLGKFQFFDQCFLNNLVDEFYVLPNRYNWMTDFQHTLRGGIQRHVKEHVAILHFSGPCKPWGKDEYNHHSVRTMHRLPRYLVEVKAVSPFLDDDFIANVERHAADDFRFFSNEKMEEVYDYSKEHTCCSSCRQN